MPIKITLYKITHIDTKRVYIGYTSQEINKYWKQHIDKANRKSKSNRYFYRALKKYGKDAFSFEIIAEYDDVDIAKIAEIQTIAEYKSNVVRYGDAFGFNMTDGGDGHRGGLSEEHKQNISIALKGRPGRKHTEETKQKISISKKGMVSPNKGKTGQIPWNKGKKASDETKLRQSEARKGKPTKKGKDRHPYEMEERIRQEYANGNTTWKKLGLKYNLSDMTIGDIIHFRHCNEKPTEISKTEVVNV